MFCNNKKFNNLLHKSYHFYFFTLTIHVYLEPVQTSANRVTSRNERSQKIGSQVFPPEPGNLNQYTFHPSQVEFPYHKIENRMMPQSSNGKNDLNL